MAQVSVAWLKMILATIEQAQSETESESVFNLLENAVTYIEDKICELSDEPTQE